MQIHETASLFNQSRFDRLPLSELEEKVDMRMWPNLEQLFHEEGIHALELLKTIEKKIEIIKKELKTNQQTNYFSPELLFIRKLYHITNVGQLDKSEFKILRDSLNSYHAFKKSYDLNIQGIQERVFFGWIHSMYQKTVASSEICIQKPQGSSGIMAIGHKPTVFATSEQLAQEEWIKVSDNEDEETYLIKEVFDTIRRYKQKGEDKKFYGNYLYHSSSSAALPGIAQHKALLSRIELKERNQHIVSGERSDASPRVYSYRNYHQSRSYATVSWFDEYPITIAFDGKKVKKLEEAYAPDSGISLGHQVPIEHISVIYAPYRNFFELKKWVDMHCPSIQADSYEVRDNMAEFTLL